jgi:hypothetical protein
MGPNFESSEWAKNHIIHEPLEAFLLKIGENKDNFTFQNIHIRYEGQIEEDYMKSAELKLADRAIKKGCVYLIDINYTFNHPEIRAVGILAQGLIKKK